jgi:hypothetical protein
MVCACPSSTRLNEWSASSRAASGQSPAGVERFDERVRVLEVQQDSFRARAAGQHVRELAVDPVEQGGAQEQILVISNGPWLRLPV